MNSSYSYTARDSRGETVRGTVEAPGRSAALAALKARGLVPVSLADGPGAARPRRTPKTRWLAAAAALLALLLLAPLLRPAKTAAPRRARPKPAAARPVAGIPARKPSAPKPAPAVAAAEPPAAAAPAAAVPAAPARPPVRGAQRRAAEAKARGEELPKPLFRHESECILALYLDPSEDPVPHPVPDDFEADMRRALAEDIPVYDTDTAGQLREKELVAWIKEDLRKWVAGGGTALDYLDRLKARQAEDAALYSDARRVLSEYAASGDTAETLAAFKALNAKLAEKGLPDLRLPRRISGQLRQ